MKKTLSLREYSLLINKFIYEIKTENSMYFSEWLAENRVNINVDMDRDEATITSDYPEALTSFILKYL